MERVAAIILVMALILTGCVKKNSSTVNGSGTTGEPTESAPNTTDLPSGSTGPGEKISAPVTEVGDESVQKMAELVFADASPCEMLQYVNSKMEIDSEEEMISMQESDSLLLIFESIQKAWCDYYRSILINNSLSAEMRTQWLEKLKEDGFKTHMTGGIELPVPDYGVYRKWEDRLSAWFRDYLYLAQLETDSPAVVNERLVITPDELEERILIASEYLEKYPQSVRVNEIIGFYDMYLYAYLYGYDPDTVINPGTGSISMDFYNRYREFVAKNPSSKAAELISEYIEVIEKSSFALTEDIMSFQENTFSNLSDSMIVVRKDIGRQILMERVGKLLPEKTGFVWRCSGFAEYGHTASLTDIHTEDGNPVYTVTGKVDDLSDRQAPLDDFSIQLQYRIEKNVLYQHKEAPYMMDSDFNDLEIIRYPFIVGHRWQQHLEDNEMDSYTVETEIIGVYRENGVDVYEVEYRNLSGGGNEKRLIQAGMGTIGFTKLYSDGKSEPFEIGYTILEEQTGYISGL